ncbi:hypothetical protein SAMN02910315_00021 [Methanobrevibacter millerae]|uniref:Uncharacterized protein n=2 Tax=Methanobrevibacter millerae TaxID=230361 RepID=A0A1G5UTS5_9EURY|nr:hypothetical protein SAMN02910315_00021 [Methanobrevibacter millerae]
MLGRLQFRFLSYFEKEVNIVATNIKMGVNNMHDLKKVEEKFHEYLNSRLIKGVYRIDELKLTEDLLEQQEAFYIPFGWISYFLVIEDEKPVVYVNACTRMDLDIIGFVDENGYEDYDLWDKNLDKEVSKRYRNAFKNVKKFDYDDLKFISDVER